MSDYTDYFKAVKACSNEAQSALMWLWNQIDLSDPAYSKAVLFEYVPAIVETYGEAAAEAAAEMYEAVMLAEINASRNIAIAGINSDGITRSVRYAAGFIYEGNYTKALSVLSRAVDYYVKQPARDTIEQNVKIDKEARFARVPQGPTTCEFCLMLASRGFVYLSKESASHGYHTDCDCLPVVSFSDDPAVEGYDPDYYYGLYQQMQDKDKWNRAHQRKKDEGRL